MCPVNTFPTLADRDKLIGDAGCDRWQFHWGSPFYRREKAQPLFGGQARLVATEDEYY